MKKYNLSVASYFDGEKIHTNKTLIIEDGFIKSIEDFDQSANELLTGLLVPGFIDCQVNGGGGYLFNQSPNLETIKKIAIAHQHFGTTGWLPTIVTDSVDIMENAADAVAEALAIVETGVIGIHFEGPHISNIKKGIHSEQFIRGLSQSEKDLYARKDLGQIIVTLAPEKVAPEIIAELTDLGVIVCLGHSNATFEQATQALEAGARGFTHLFNAMSAFTSREPGMVGTALLNKDCFSGLILDGVHVHPESAKLAIHANKNVFLVTDAMPPVGVETGSGKDSFEFFGKKVFRDNKSLTDHQGRLAGSVLDMNTAVNNAMSMLGLNLQAAINLASQKPAKFLGLEDRYGTLDVGKKANMLLVNEKQAQAGKAFIEIQSSWINGQKII